MRGQICCFGLPKIVTWTLVGYRERWVALRGTGNDLD